MKEPGTRPADAAAWEKLYAVDEESWAQKLVDEDYMNLYLSPCYRRFFAALLDPDCRTFLELGAGNGVHSRAIRSDFGDRMPCYAISDYSLAACRRLRHLDFSHVFNIDAQRLPFAAHSIDVIFGIGFLHHTDYPERSLAEMKRVARRHILLVEANGLCLLRRLKELTPGYRVMGERSYTRRQYLEMLAPLGEWSVKELFPFNFPLPVPGMPIGAKIAFNEALRQIPGLRWQCSELVIHLARGAR